MLQMGLGGNFDYTSTKRLKSLIANDSQKGRTVDDIDVLG